ncbi:MAG: hypothetical protein AAF557_06045 [Pseudomonadota bacterium]
MTSRGLSCRVFALGNLICASELWAHTIWLLATAIGNASEEVKVLPPNTDLGAEFLETKEKTKVQDFVGKIAWDAEDMAQRSFDSGRCAAAAPRTSA